MDHLSHGVKSRIPQAPWVLYFDGASRKPSGHGGLGVVLRNSKGQIVEEERRFLGAGISSGLAKYKALLAGLKKAKSLQVKHLLVKGNSRILINQVVGRWTARDAHLRDHLKKVWVISKEFDSLFMEFIPKEHNFHADCIANAAIDKELQIQEVVSNYFDRSNAAWQQASSPPKSEPTPVTSPPSRILTPFSNLKLRPVSPPHPKPLKTSCKNVTMRIPVSSNCGDTSDSDLTRTIKSLTSAKTDRFWADRLSISDEASTSTASEELEGFFKSSSLISTVENNVAGPAARGSEDDSCGEDACDEEQEFNCKSRNRSGGANVVDSAAAAGSTSIQLSEVDCDRLVEAVIERLKKTRMGDPTDTRSCLQHHL